MTQGAFPGLYEMRTLFEFTLEDYGDVTEFTIDLIFPSEVLAQKAEVCLIGKYRKYFLIQN